MADGTPIIVKKKKIVAAGHHGGSWKVAYADFVTAMMAFFMVMWIMGMDPSTKSMIAGYFNDPFGVVKSPPQSKTPFALPGSPQPKTLTGNGTAGERQEDFDREKKQLDDLQQEVRQQLSKGAEGSADFAALLDHVVTNVTDEGLRLEFVEMAGSVFFLSGDSRIRPEAEALVAAVAPVLAKSKRPIKVEGHTDARPYNGAGYTNWELSTERALEMRRVLTRYGVPLSQFAEVRGFADKMLKIPSDPYNFANRRVTVLLPFRTADADVQHSLPGKAFVGEIQGAFKAPIDLKPHLGGSN